MFAFKVENMKVKLIAFKIENHKVAISQTTVLFLTMFEVWVSASLNLTLLDHEK